MNPIISAIICTYNRCESLSDTLKSLIEQSIPKGWTLEILVIDNNSTDETKRVVQDASGVSRWPIRRVREPQQGIAHARNRGLLSARGQYIAFIDDIYSFIGIIYFNTF